MRCNPRELLGWCAQIATALEFLHSCPDGGFAHRDVHARNIIIRPDDTACLIDFDTILWGDAADSNIINLSNLTPGPNQPGLGGAKQGDVRSLGLTLLRAFARDVDSSLDLPALTEAAVASLRPYARGSPGRSSLLSRVVGGPSEFLNRISRIDSKIVSTSHPAPFVH